ncbi:endochitinase isoform X3 [Vigna radiata var. radiata]|uniref:chitinase n=1 Tax=Vigna radiata var. radiata TaxID=3916 RepID=A0A3Q0F4X7_VIGRR|nr:endochitinase isoform X3 [Vigna radiata var. radiata]
MGTMKLCSLMLCLLLASVLGATAEQCGKQAGGALCPNGLCCSKFGWCGDTDSYCGEGCQSQCKSGPKPTPTPSTPTPSTARSFSGFGTTGDDNTRKKEIAAFLAQTSHETTGGWGSAPDGPYAWGYCFINEQNQAVYCDGGEWPCAAGKKYYGRGPIQLTHNYNYGQAGKALNLDLTNNPDLVATDATVSFKTALWFWMTAQANKPSSHDVITGRWTPSSADTSAGRVPGFGVITNIINGGIECGHGQDDRVQDRVGFYQRYCQLMGINPGGNLDCNSQRPFA